MNDLIGTYLLPPVDGHSVMLTTRYDFDCPAMTDEEEGAQAYGISITVCAVDGARGTAHLGGIWLGVGGARLTEEDYSLFVPDLIEDAIAEAIPC